MNHICCARTCAAQSEGLNQAKSGLVNLVHSHQHCSLISSCLPLLFSSSASEMSSASKVCLLSTSYYALCFYYHGISESVTNRFHLDGPFYSRSISSLPSFSRSRNSSTTHAYFECAFIISKLYTVQTIVEMA